MPTSNGTTSNEIKPKPPKRAQRRRFTVAEKLRIVQAADDCRPGTLGALMRREGIYSSQLYAWKRQRDRGELDPGASRKRTRDKAQQQAVEKRNAELERENRKLKRKLARAEVMVEIQKKFAGLLGIDLESPETNGGAE